MSILNYFKESFRRKNARKFTREYPIIIDSFNLIKEGKIDFANWDNPLVTPIELSQTMVDFFKQFIKKGDLVIDIGANIGDTTVPMALAAGSSGITLGFDPNPYVYKILEKNASLNVGKQNIIPLLFAITENEEAFYYISSEASFANGAISTTKNSRHGTFIYPDKIKGINLKTFLEEKYKSQLNKFSFLKIDTEGYDKEIIKSISGLVREFKPVIVAESFGENTKLEKIELYTILDQLGYEIFYFEDFKLDTKVIRLKNGNELANWTNTINIYAIPIINEFKPQKTDS